MKIVIKDGQLNAMPAINANDLTNVLLSALLGCYRATVESAPEQHKEAVKRLLFDTFNIAASEFLKEFDPESDLHPELTELAIMEAEDAILERGKDNAVS